MPVANGARSVYNTPAFLQNAFQRQQHTPSRPRTIVSILKLLLYLVCTFSVFHLTRYTFDKLRAVLDFVETQQLKSIRTEKKIQKLQTALDLAQDELRRLKEERRKSQWDLEHTLLRDYISKADNKASMKQLRESVSVDLKQVDSKLAKKQHRSREALHEDLRNMYDRLLQMQADQNNALQRVILRVTTSGAGAAPIDTAHLANIDDLDRPYSIPRNKGSEKHTTDDYRLDKSNLQRETVSSHFGEDDSETTYSDDDKIYSTNHDAALPSGGRRYIQDLLSAEVAEEKVDEVDDFDNIFKQHMNDIQNSTPMSYSSLTPSTFGFPDGTSTDNTFDVDHVNTNTHKEKEVVSSEGPEAVPVETDEALATRSTGGISIIPEGIGGGDNSHENEEGIIYESMNFISKDIVAQQLTQTFKESVMKDEKMKKSKLMSFFDTYTTNPQSLEESIHQSVDQQTKFVDSESAVQTISSDETWDRNAEIPDSVESSKNMWEMDEEAKKELNALFGKKLGIKEEEAAFDLPENEEILRAESEFDVYDFDEDSLFNSRLQSCRESGEFADLASRTGGDEEALLKLKGNYFSYSVNPCFDLDIYRRRMKQRKDAARVEAKSATSVEVPILAKSPTKQSDDQPKEQKTSKKKNTSRLKPWEKKKGAS